MVRTISIPIITILLIMTGCKNREASDTVKHDGHDIIINSQVDGAEGISTSLIDQRTSTLGSANGTGVGTGKLEKGRMNIRLSGKRAAELTFTAPSCGNKSDNAPLFIIPMFGSPDGKTIIRRWQATSEPTGTLRQQVWAYTPTGGFVKSDCGGASYDLQLQQGWNLIDVHSAWNGQRVTEEYVNSDKSSPLTWKVHNLKNDATTFQKIFPQN